MITSIEHKDELSGKVRNLLSFLKHDIDHTSQLHSIGINTKLSSSLEDLFTNPLSAMLDIHKISTDKLKQLSNQLTVAFFRSQKDLITKAFQVDQSNRFVYYVVLKEDNTEHRDVFFNFLSFYDEIGIQDNIPVMIKFLPERVMDKAGLKDEVSLN